MRKFGAPGSCVWQYGRWSVLLRPAQVTLGSLVLAAHDQATAFSHLEAPSFVELQRVTRDLERALFRAFEYDKINYLMLMMVDPDVHFHVIPRYAGPRMFEGHEFTDFGWPGPPELGRINATDAGMVERIRAHLGSIWG